MWCGCSINFTVFLSQRKKNSFVAMMVQNVEGCYIPHAIHRTLIHELQSSSFSFCELLNFSEILGFFSLPSKNFRVMSIHFYNLLLLLVKTNPQLQLKYSPNSNIPSPLLLLFLKKNTKSKRSFV